MSRKFNIDLIKKGRIDIDAKENYIKESLINSSKAKTFDDLYKRFSNIENHSLNKFYKEKRLFEDKSFDTLSF